MNFKYLLKFSARVINKNKNIKLNFIKYNTLNFSESVKRGENKAKFIVEEKLSKIYEYDNAKVNFLY
jgi:hypothetical protein